MIDMSRELPSAQKDNVRFSQTLFLKLHLSHEFFWSRPTTSFLRSWRPQFQTLSKWCRNPHHKCCKSDSFECRRSLVSKTPHDVICVDKSISFWQHICQAECSGMWSVHTLQLWWLPPEVNIVSSSRCSIRCNTHILFWVSRQSINMHVENFSFGSTNLWIST